MKRPNILFLIADQHRYDCVGYSNRNKNGIKTPNIDKLCEEGIWFNNAYTTSPVCCPARQSLIAGRRPETLVPCGITILLFPLDVLNRRIFLMQDF